MCLACVVSSVENFVIAVNAPTIDESSKSNVGQTFKSLVSTLDAAARFDHSENRFPWAKAVAVLAPQMTSACMSSGKFESPSRKRMLEFARHSLIRLTSAHYTTASADSERRLVESLQQIRNLETLDESENQTQERSESYISANIATNTSSENQSATDDSQPLL